MGRHDALAELGFVGRARGPGQVNEIVVHILDVHAKAALQCLEHLRRLANFEESTDA